MLPRGPSDRAIGPRRRGRVPLYVLFLLLFQISSPAVVLNELFPGPVVCKMACAGTPDCCCKKRAANRGHRPERRDGPVVERETCPSGCAVTTTARPGNGNGLRPAAVEASSLTPSHELVRTEDPLRIFVASIPGLSRAPPA
jgi:hypothetical protein